MYMNVIFARNLLPFTDLWLKTAGEFSSQANGALCLQTLIKTSHNWKYNSKDIWKVSTIAPICSTWMFTNDNAVRYVQWFQESLKLIGSCVEVICPCTCSQIELSRFALTCRSKCFYAPYQCTRCTEKIPFNQNKYFTLYRNYEYSSNPRMAHTNVWNLYSTTPITCVSFICCCRLVHASTQLHSFILCILLLLEQKQCLN